ncbi:hypothetical protein N9995_00255, partial [bacterium]|nr:hypothetical protein [bacterium]
ALGLVPDGAHSVLKGTQRKRGKNTVTSRCFVALGLEEEEEEEEFRRRRRRRRVFNRKILRGKPMVPDGEHSVLKGTQTRKSVGFPVFSPSALIQR